MTRVEELEASEPTDLKNGATTPTEEKDPCAPDSEFDARERARVELESRLESRSVPSLAPLLRF